MKAILALGRILGLKVTVEGVEPMPAKDIETLLKTALIQEGFL